MSVCADCGRLILSNEGSYATASPGTPPKSYHTGCGDPFGTKARDAEINRLRSRAENAEDTVLGQFKEIETLRAALVEAERERDGKSAQIVELQEQLHHLYGVEQRAEHAEFALAAEVTRLQLKRQSDD